MGKWIGFVTFSGICDVDLMIKKLSDVWYGFYKIFASVPRVVKKEKLSSTIPSKIEKQDNTYASVLRGQSLNKQPVESSEVAIFLNSGDFINENKELAYLAKARDFQTLVNLGMFCHDEGLDDFQIRYVGGLLVMFEFQTKDACKNFMSSDVINHWITEKKLG